MGLSPLGDRMGQGDGVDCYIFHSIKLGGGVTTPDPDPPVVWFQSPAPAAIPALDSHSRGPSSPARVAGVG